MFETLLFMVEEATKLDHGITYTKAHAYTNMFTTTSPVAPTPEFLEAGAKLRTAALRADLITASSLPGMIAAPIRPPALACS
jgi:hypothetical protein